MAGRESKVFGGGEAVVEWVVREQCQRVRSMYLAAWSAVGNCRGVVGAVIFRRQLAGMAFEDGLQ